MLKETFRILKDGDVVVIMRDAAPRDDNKRTVRGQPGQGLAKTEMRYVPPLAPELRKGGRR